MKNRRLSNNGGNSPVMDFIKKYGLVIGVLLIGIPYLYRYYVSAQADDEVQALQQDDKTTAAQAANPVTALAGLNKITTRTELHDIARNTAYHFGTNVQIKNADWSSWFNPRGWSENDEKAFNQLKQIKQATSRDLVVKCYYFLTQRDLSSDVRTLLDDEYKKQLPLFK